MKDIVSLIDGKVLKRFWSKVDVKTENECWPWLGHCNPYGIFHIMLEYKVRHNLTAHKASYIINNKENIEDDIQVCHTCDNPVCVNPNHLFLGTAKDNAKDKSNKGRCFSPNMNGENNKNSKLTEDQVIEIRRRYETENIMKKDLAEEYGIDPPCIYKIVNRLTWKNV